MSTLFSTPKVHIADFFVQTDLDEQYRDATIGVRPRLERYAEMDLDGWTVDAQTLRRRPARLS